MAVAGVGRLASSVANWRAVALAVGVTLGTTVGVAVGEGRLVGVWLGSGVAVSGRVGKRVWVAATAARGVPPAGAGAQQLGWAVPPGRPPVPEGAVRPGTTRPGYGDGSS